MKDNTTAATGLKTVASDLPDKVKEMADNAVSGDDLSQEGAVEEGEKPTPSEESQSQH